MPSTGFPVENIGFFLLGKELHVYRVVRFRKRQSKCLVVGRN